MANLQRFVVKTQHQALWIRKITGFEAFKAHKGLTIARKSLKIPFNTQETQCVHIFNLLLALLYWPRFLNCGGGSLRD